MGVGTFYETDDRNKECVAYMDANTNTEEIEKRWIMNIWVVVAGLILVII